MVPPIAVTRKKHCQVLSEMREDEEWRALAYEYRTAASENLQRQQRKEVACSAK